MWAEFNLRRNNRAGINFIIKLQWCRVFQRGMTHLIYLGRLWRAIKQNWHLWFINHSLGSSDFLGLIKRHHSSELLQTPQLFNLKYCIGITLLGSSRKRWSECWQGSEALLPPQMPYKAHPCALHPMNAPDGLKWDFTVTRRPKPVVVLPWHSTNSQRTKLGARDEDSSSQLVVYEFTDGVPVFW